MKQFTKSRQAAKPQTLTSNYLDNLYQYNMDKVRSINNSYDHRPLSLGQELKENDHEQQQLAQHRTQGVPQPLNLQQFESTPGGGETGRSRRIESQRIATQSSGRDAKYAAYPNGSCERFGGKSHVPHGTEGKIVPILKKRGDGSSQASTPTNFRDRQQKKAFRFDGLSRQEARSGVAEQTWKVSTNELKSNQKDRDEFIRKTHDQLVLSMNSQLSRKQMKIEQEERERQLMKKIEAQNQRLSETKLRPQLTSGEFDKQIVSTSPLAIGQQQRALQTSKNQRKEAIDFRNILGASAFESTLKSQHLSQHLGQSKLEQKTVFQSEFPTLQGTQPSQTTSHLNTIYDMRGHPHPGDVHGHHKMVSMLEHEASLRKQSPYQRVSSHDSQSRGRAPQDYNNLRFATHKAEAVYRTSRQASEQARSCSESKAGSRRGSRLGSQAGSLPNSHPESKTNSRVHSHRSSRKRNSMTRPNTFDASNLHEIKNLMPVAGVAPLRVKHEMNEQRLQDDEAARNLSRLKQIQEGLCSPTLEAQFKLIKSKTFEKGIKNKKKKLADKLSELRDEFDKMFPHKPTKHRAKSQGTKTGFLINDDLPVSRHSFGGGSSKKSKKRHESSNRSLRASSSKKSKAPLSISQRIENLKLQKTVLHPDLEASRQNNDRMRSQNYESGYTNYHRYSVGSARKVAMDASKLKYDNPISSTHQIPLKVSCPKKGRNTLLSPAKSTIHEILSPGTHLAVRSSKQQNSRLGYDTTPSVEQPMFTMHSGHRRVNGEQDFIGGTSRNPVIIDANKSLKQSKSQLQNSRQGNSGVSLQRKQQKLQSILASSQKAILRNHRRRQAESSIDIDQEGRSLDLGSTRTKLRKSHFPTQQSAKKKKKRGPGRESQSSISQSASRSSLLMKHSSNSRRFAKAGSLGDRVQSSQKKTSENNFAYLSELQALKDKVGVLQKQLNHQRKASGGSSIDLSRRPRQNSSRREVLEIHPEAMRHLKGQIRSQLVEEVRAQVKDEVAKAVAQKYKAKFQKKLMEERKEYISIIQTLKAEVNAISSSYQTFMAEHEEEKQQTALLFQQLAFKDQLISKQGQLIASFKKGMVDTGMMNEQDVAMRIEDTNKLQDETMPDMNEDQTEVGVGHLPNAHQALCEQQFQSGERQIEEVNPDEGYFPTSTNSRPTEANHLLTGSLSIQSYRPQTLGGSQAGQRQQVLQQQQLAKTQPGTNLASMTKVGKGRRQKSQKSLPRKSSSRKH